MNKTYDFDFKNGDFVIDNRDVLVLSDIHALKKWIEKVLHTQLDRYKIYEGTSYGINAEDLIIGKTYGIDFIESELKRECENALLIHDDIQSITSFLVSAEHDTLNVYMTLSTVYGALEVKF